MKRFVIESWLLLFFFECVMRFRSFETRCEIVRKKVVRPKNLAGGPSSETLCHAMDYACVFYFKQVQCLQRSSATTLLLRHYGWSAKMVIGAQVLPSASHAWVEINGRIVNDKPCMPEIYQILKRC
jgi:Transglutaminase-like superfamily